MARRLNARRAAALKEKQVQQQQQQQQQCVLTQPGDLKIAPSTSPEAGNKEREGGPASVRPRSVSQRSLKGKQVQQQKQQQHCV